MQSIKEFKRGEVLFKEGDTLNEVYIVQQGRVSAYLERSGKKIEIEQLSNSQMVGETAIFDRPKAPYTVEAIANSKVLVVPLNLMQSINEQSATGVKLLIRSLYEGVKLSRNSLKSLKMETDSSPCPEKLVARVFSQFVLLSKHLGKQNEDGSYTISWQSLKLYSTRVFLESPQRLMSAIELLTKLDYADFTKTTNDEGEEEVTDIIFKDLQFIEDFAEFFQYHLYKPGRSEVMYVDDIAYKLCRFLIELCDGQEVNHKGAVELVYEELVKTSKQKIKLELKNTHWDLLEKKGLMVQRKSTDDGIFLLLDPVEFSTTFHFWTVLREIDKWNVQGFVNMNEVEEEASEGGSEACSECDGDITEKQKFCHHCGHKLAA